MNETVKITPPADFSAIMADIQKANEQHGIDFRGKSYLEVSKRVEVFRKHYGMTAGIVTEVLHLGVVQGDTVAIRASITNTDGRTVATGTASEVIGQGNVNRASALENAETSAIGRALATLGLHGGEFASLNEMAAIGHKPENRSAQGLADAWEDAVMDGLPDDPSAETLAGAYADQMEADVKGYKSEDGLNGYMRRKGSIVRFIEEHSPEHHSQLRAAVLAHREALTKG